MAFALLKINFWQIRPQLLGYAYLHFVNRWAEKPGSPGTQAYIIISDLEHIPIEVFHSGHVRGQLQTTDTKYAFIKEGSTLKLTINMAAVKNLGRL